MARLVVNPDSPEAWEIELRQGSNSLGRSEQNDFQIEHSSVSSSHCQIVVSGQNATLKDVGSISGTFLGGQLVEEAKLRSGDVFCLGDVLLRFEAQSPLQPSPPVATRLPGARASSHVSPRPRLASEPRFVARVAAAFLYPLKKDGVLMLLTGTLFLSIIDAGKFFARFAAVKAIGVGSGIGLAFLALLTAFGAGYLTSYLRRVVNAAAMGDQAAPDWPDLSDFAADIFAPFFQLLATILASLLPTIIVVLCVQSTEKSAQPAVWVAWGLGVIYFPMAFLGVAMFDSLAALNPLLVVPSIVKVAGAYFFVVAVFSAVIAAKSCGDRFLPKAIPIPVVPSVITTMTGLYLLTVEARVLGLLYLVNQRRLAWFGRREI